MCCIAICSICLVGYGTLSCLLFSCVFFFVLFFEGGGGCGCLMWCIAMCGIFLWGYGAMVIALINTKYCCQWFTNFVIVTTTLKASTSFVNYIIIHRTYRGTSILFNSLIRMNADLFLKCVFPLKMQTLSNTS